MLKRLSSLGNKVLKNTKCRSYSTDSPKTGIILMNMGGPKSDDQVKDYLHRIMTDRDMIQLPVQDYLGPWIAKRRTKEVKEKYRQIGGGSPILTWTNKQGMLLTDALNIKLPDHAPFKHYVAFRYVTPFIETALEEAAQDNVERVIFFSQYPQYSCATSGSSFNTIFDYFSTRTIDPKVRYSVIDRWGDHPLLAKVFAERIKDKLGLFNLSVRDEVMILFSAHSLPLKAVSRGDTYPHEIAATVSATMAALNVPNPHRLVWQSKVGPLPWLQPYTDEAMENYVLRGIKNFILVPIAFVNEHIETLHELDIEYCHDLAKKIGAQKVERASTPNDHPIFIQTMADVVHKHIESGATASNQFLSRCPQCTSKRCCECKLFFRKLCKVAETKPTPRVEEVRHTETHEAKPLM